MILLSYDIHDDKLRARFSKYIKKYGHRMQYSVYEIDNSQKILDNICVEIQNIFEKRFTQEDSVLIFNMSNTCTIQRFGYAKNEESDLVII